MSIWNRWLSSGRVRSATRRLAKDPSARRYAELVQEYAVQGSYAEAHEIANEGLKAYAGDLELKRLAERALSALREGRIRELQGSIAQAPRPALWRELCEIQLEAGRVARAEELAGDWFQQTKSGEAQYYRARARAERFFADRRRDDGLLAFEYVTQAEKVLPNDARTLRLRLQLASRCGAWTEARRALARLLELEPGDPHLEARFRTVLSLAEDSRTIEQALRDVERTGRFADEDAAEQQPSTTSGAVRPTLQMLARQSGVQGAFYVRGATALVQGPKGPTAERTARGVREVVASCRTAARRLGLGQALAVRIEGEFGTLLVSPGELGAGALWCNGTITRQHEEGLRELAGIAGRTEETE